MYIPQAPAHFFYIAREQRKLRIQEELATLLRNTNRQIKNYQDILQDIEKSANRTPEALDLQKIKEGSSLLVITGEYNPKHSAYTTVLAGALEDIASGRPVLNDFYYRVYSFRDVDTHLLRVMGIDEAVPEDTITHFTIALAPSKQHAELTFEELNSCVYYLRNLEVVQQLKTKGLVK